MTRPVTVTLTVTTSDMDAVREWLAEYGGGAPRTRRATLFAYVRAVLVSNSEWDGVPVTVRPLEPDPAGPML